MTFSFDVNKRIFCLMYTDQLKDVGQYIPRKHLAQNVQMK